MSGEYEEGVDGGPAAILKAGAAWEVRDWGVGLRRQGGERTSMEERAFRELMYGVCA
jgi:hypothetical protein